MNLSILAIRLIVTVGIAVVLAMGGTVGWMWVKGQSKQLQINNLQTHKLRLEAEQAFCETQRLSLAREFDKLRAELDSIAELSRLKITESKAIAARSEEQAAHYERRLIEMRETWPDDCVSAVSHVRGELNL